MPLTPVLTQAASVNAWNTDRHTWSSRTEIYWAGVTGKLHTFFDFAGNNL